MNKIGPKDKLIKAAMELSMEFESLEMITSREISSRAGVNLALINYYFGSKDNLLTSIAEEKMNQLIMSLFEGFDNETPIYDKIKILLLETARYSFDNINFFRILTKREIELGCKNSINLFKPYFKMLLADIREEALMILLVQLIVPFQNIILNPEEYGRLLNTDFFNRYERERKIVDMLDDLLKNYKIE